MENPMIRVKNWPLWKNYWLPVMIPVIMLILYSFFNHNTILVHKSGVGGGDEPSYVLFNFSSLKAIFDQHRTFGLPLLIKCYSICFKDFRVWPYFYMTLYIFSVLYLYRSFIKFGFSKILSLIVAIFLLWHRASYGGFSEIMSEPLVAVFLNFVIGTLLLTVIRKNWQMYLWLGVTTFYLYQVRPNFFYVAFLVPFWAVGVILLTKKTDLSNIVNFFFRYAAISILPLIFFCLLRFFVVGEFGVCSLAGGCLAGHATHYLNEENIKLLSGDSRQLAEEILKRKRKFSYPANLSPFSQAIIPGMTSSELEASCFGSDLMMTWLVGIKHETGEDPLDDPVKNIEAWKHTETLSYFYSKYYNTKVDKILMKYAKDVLRIEWKRYLKWIIRGSLLGIKDYIRGRSLWWQFFIFFGIFSVHYLGRDRLKQWRTGVLFVAMIGISLFAVGYLPIVITTFPFDRLVNILAIFFLPSVTLLLLAPVKKGEN